MATSDFQMAPTGGTIKFNPYQAPKKSPTDWFSINPADEKNAFEGVFRTNSNSNYTNTIAMGVNQADFEAYQAVNDINDGINLGYRGTQLNKNEASSLWGAFAGRDLQNTANKNAFLLNEDGTMALNRSMLPEALRGKVDANKDGKLDAKELGAYYLAMDNMDGKADGKISKENLAKVGNTTDLGNAPTDFVTKLGDAQKLFANANVPKISQDYGQFYAQDGENGRYDGVNGDVLQKSIETRNGDVLGPQRADTPESSTDNRYPGKPSEVSNTAQGESETSPDPRELEDLADDFGDRNNDWGDQDKEALAKFLKRLVKTDAELKKVDDLLLNPENKEKSQDEIQQLLYQTIMDSRKNQPDSSRRSGRSNEPTTVGAWGLPHNPDTPIVQSYDPNDQGVW